MNDEIHKLVVQAGFELWADEDWRPKNAIVDWSCNYDNELQRFAQLIVQECARIISDAVEHREPASTYVSKIAEHFGIEK